MKKSYLNELGQLFFLAMNESKWSARLEKQLGSLKPGGIIFSSRSLRAPDAATKFLGRVARTIGVPPFLALAPKNITDEPFQAFELPPLHREQGARALRCESDQVNEFTASALCGMGFNTFFIPPLAVATPRAESPGQAAGDNPDYSEVTRSFCATFRALRRHKILACPQGFPGGGDARIDSATGLWQSGKPMAAMWREDLLPFRKLLRQIPMVQVSQTAYKAYDFDLIRPAMLSRNILEGMLRIKLGFQGLALSDNLDSPPLSEKFDRAEAAVMAIHAGCDMLVLDGHDAVAILESLTKSVESGSLPASRVSQALRRIRVTKKSLSRPGGIIVAKTRQQIAHGRLAF